MSDVNVCKCLTDIDEVQYQEPNIGVCLKNQAETTKSTCLVSAKPETEKPVSEADNIEDTDKDEGNRLFMAVDESDITELFESSEMQQILGSENTKKTVTVGRQRRQSEGVYVKGKIHGIHGTFTIDTGASRTVLSEEICLKILETRRPPLTKSSILVGADGNPLVELGTALFYIHLGTVEFEKELVVAQFDDEVLLGLDILMMGKLGPTEIKLADKCIIWNGETIPCKLVGDLRRVRNVSLADDVTIPGLSELIVDVYIEKDPVDELCSNLEFLIEPSQSYMEKNPLVLAASLVDMMKNVTVKMRILNSSRTDVPFVTVQLKKLL